MFATAQSTTASGPNAVPGFDTEVLIVGAGPTGLTAAISLAQRGIRTVIVDAQATGANTSRAAVIHAHTLELLTALGVTETLVGRGIKAQQFSIRDRDRLLVPVRFDRLPTTHPYTLMISQAETEQILRDRLQQLGGEVRWQSPVARITQDADAVTAQLEDGSVLRARYVIGADGMHSRVRTDAAIAFDGDSYAQSFVLADVRLSGGNFGSDVILYFSPAGMVVVAPLPDGVHRIVATVDDAPEHPDVSYVQALLDARGPEKDRAMVQQVIWGSRFRVHHRIAASFRSGRMLLAGDAAHVHSPAGGQGMNTGIQDGIAVAAAVSSVLSGGSEQALDQYAAARRVVAAQVVGLADRLTRLATMPPAVRPFRNTVLRLLALLPPFRRQLAMRMSGLVFRTR